MVAMLLAPTSLPAQHPCAFLQPASHHRGGGRRRGGEGDGGETAPAYLSAQNFGEMFSERERERGGVTMGSILST